MSKVLAEDSDGRRRTPRHWARGGSAIDRAAVVGVVGLVILNVIDVSTTRLALYLASYHGHIVVEANPLARVLLRGGRIEALKLVVIALLAWNTFRRPRSVKVVCAIWTTVGIYLMAIANNLLAIAALK